MKNRITLTIALACMLLLTAQAGKTMKRYGEHPAYLHALSDMRAARWMLEHRPGKWAVTTDETEAVKEIDNAIAELKSASIDDGKDINYHPKVDEKDDHKGRLHDAMEYLKKAKKDVNEEEDNKFAQQLNIKIFKHIDKAVEDVEKALKAAH